MSEQLSIGAMMALPQAALDEFDDVFWSAYPRKVGKPAARRAFILARRRSSLGEIMAGLQRYPFQAEQRYVPHAATWLNQDRWMEAAPPDLSLDPWGLRAWWDAQPEHSEAMFHVRGYEFAACQEIMLASGLAVSWRGSLDVLGRWLVEGYRPDSVAGVVLEEVARSAQAARSLEWFDRAVRRRAWRWHAVRFEWVRG